MPSGYTWTPNAPRVCRTCRTCSEGGACAAADWTVAASARVVPLADVAGAAAGETIATGGQQHGSGQA